MRERQTQDIPATMRAVLLRGVTRAEAIRLVHCPVPPVEPDWVLVRIRAFGINHAEQILRLEEITAEYIQKPVIPGIECVGEIADASNSRFFPGQKVVALMGGMGRSFNGSYAEYALLPAHHVFSVDVSLQWEELAAVPETYFTAWGSLFHCLCMKPGEHLLVRGASCALGHAVLQLAKALGCKVTATTHRAARLAALEQMGADVALLDDGLLAGRVQGIAKALELVGPKTLRDTLRCVEPGGVVCNTGILGGEYELNSFDPIKEIPNGVYLTGFFSNTPTQGDIDDIFSFLEKHHLTPCLGKVYDFDDIKTALEDMDRKRVQGKVVIRVA
ncbi:MAG: zinc-binding dehydrogenase [Desulfovibrio sp.]|nr:zinc-binding dehydrogenase [Desulfovibrio sp.]